MRRCLKVTIVLSATFTFLAVSTGDGGKTVLPAECAYTVGNYCCPNDGRINFEKYNITPGVFKSVPKYIATVVYQPGKNYSYVCMGNEITSDITIRQPEVSWPIESETCLCYYTLIMYGTLLSFKHWIVVNIPGNNVSAGKSVTDYFPPVPPPLTGPHSYGFGVYKQPDCETIADKESPLVSQDILFRPFFNINKFVEEYELELYAANFFLCISNLTPFFNKTLLE